MVLIVLLGGLAGFMGVFSLAFLDHCPPATCSVDGAVTAVMTALALAALVGLVGMVLTIVRLAQQNRRGRSPWNARMLCRGPFRRSDGLHRGRRWVTRLRPSCPDH